MAALGAAALGAAAIGRRPLRLAAAGGLAAVHDHAHVAASRVDPGEQVVQPLPERTGDDQLLDGRLFRVSPA